MKFVRYQKNPLISREKKTFHSLHAANPDLLEFRDRMFLYFRGQGNEEHDQIGVASIKSKEFNGIDWEHFDKNPIIKVSEHKNDYDNRHILDPGAVVFKEKVFLYYSGHSYDKPACVCLAISEDGFTFDKYLNNPIIKGAIAPEVVLKDNLLYLFYQKKNQNGYFEFFCSTSNDGVEFFNETKIFEPNNSPDTFDAFSVSTCRIWKEDSSYYMIYGGSDKFDDYPSAFGLAKSNDLLSWERYPDNPVFQRGEAGTWDEGGIWFGTVYKHEGIRFMWYEGCGAGIGLESEEARLASSICRNEDYGGYARFNFSQIGLATNKAKTIF